MKRSLSALLSSLIPALVLCGCGGGASAPAAYRLRYNFQVMPDAGQPAGGVVADAAGNLYGTTVAGGTNRLGAVYRIDAVTGVESVLHSFLGSTQHDGAGPVGSLVADSAGNLYGVASSGGDANAGTVFRIDAKTHEVTTVYAFSGGPQDGREPHCTLRIDKNGNLFGTTEYGGTNETGTVYEITPDGHETVLASFGTANAGGPVQPSGDLALDASGNLYGTSQYGGPSGDGTIWKLAPAGGSTAATLTVLHNFTGAPQDGTQPSGGVLLDASSGTLYGTTRQGGPNSTGTVFSCGVDGSSERIVYAFGDTASNDGAEPSAPLVMDHAGVLYGTTRSGGTGFGTVFSVDPASGTETVLHRFGGFAAGDGQIPKSSLLIDATGQLVGVTALGGAKNLGVVYTLPR